MKMVAQRGADDCLRAAIASLLELDYDDVPDFGRPDDLNWWKLVLAFRPFCFAKLGSIVATDRMQAVAIVNTLPMGSAHAVVVEGRVEEPDGGGVAHLSFRVTWDPFEKPRYYFPMHVDTTLIIPILETGGRRDG